MGMGGGGGSQTNLDATIMGGSMQDAEAAEEKARKDRIAAAGQRYQGGMWSTGEQGKAAGDQGGQFPTQGGWGAPQGYPKYGGGFSANWWDH